MERKLPHWDMTGIYPAPDSKEFLDDIALLGRIGDEIISETEKEFPSAERLINLKDKGDSLEITLTAYTDALISADSENPVLLRASALAEDASIRYDKADDAYIRCIDEKADISSVPERFRYSIYRIKKMAGHLMTSEEESLASELSKTGEKAWEKLMESVTSVAADGGMTLTSLRAEAMNPDREKRECAYRRELKLLETHKTAVAAALNGVKGTVLTLEKRRGWDDPIERSLFSSAISKKTLEALLSAMEDSLPMFRRYFNLKARMLGLDKLSFFDLFAPVGSGSRSYSFEEAMNLVIDSYSSFSPEMGRFAEMAFEKGWLDAEPRHGKAGGAYDVYFPERGESRVFLNFDSSYDSVATIAHELGHAYHDSVVRDLPPSLSAYPMTLAETASIFGEMLLFDKVLSTCDKEESVTIIESFVQNAAQVIVDILSRYLFEKRVFERRKEGEITADELSDMMLQAQEYTYGDALDEKHKYMWAVKSHYYSADFSYYNYPYAFGELFALSLYSRKNEEGFPELYKAILRSTGMMDAESVAAAAGCDTEDKAFWMAGLGVIEKYIEELEKWN